MLKIILIIILAVITTIAVIIIRSSSAPKKDIPSDEVDPSTLVRMRRAPGVEAKPDFIVPEWEEGVDYIAPSPLDYIDEMPEHFREPSMTDLLLDEDVPLEKKQRIAEELCKLGYAIAIKDIDAGGNAGVLSEPVSQEEEGSFQEESVEKHPELAEPEEVQEEESPQAEVSPADMQRWPGVDNSDRLALAMEIQELVNSRMFPPELAEVAARLLETEITIPAEDATQENYDRADLILNSTDVSGYSFDMFSDYCHSAVGKRHIEVEKPKGEEELPGEDIVAPARTTLPSDDMSNDISWGMIEA